MITATEVPTNACICHVCGRLHRAHGAFTSTLLLPLLVDGRQIQVPGRSCGAHTPAEVRRAWESHDYRTVTHYAQFRIDCGDGW